MSEQRSIFNTSRFPHRASLGGFHNKKEGDGGNHLLMVLSIWGLDEHETEPHKSDWLNEVNYWITIVQGWKQKLNLFENVVEAGSTIEVRLSPLPRFPADSHMCSKSFPSCHDTVLNKSYITNRFFLPMHSLRPNQPYTNIDNTN